MEIVSYYSNAHAAVWHPIRGVRLWTAESGSSG